MSTITREFTKEQLIARAETVLSNARTAADFHDSKPYHLMDVHLAEIALASLEAEPVGEVVLGEYDDCGCHPDARVACIAADGQADWENFKDGTRLYTAPPAPVVQDIGEIRVGRLPTMNQDDYPGLGDWWVQLRIGEDSDEVLARVYGATPQEANSRAEALACRAAMLQGADGNYPVIPDGLNIRAVAALRETVRNQWLKSDDFADRVYWKSMHDIANEIVSAMLAAAPRQEVK